MFLRDDTKEELPFFKVAGISLRVFFFLIRIIEVNQKIASLQRPIIVKPTAGRPDHQSLPRRGIVVSHVFKLKTF